MLDLITRSRVLSNLNDLSTTTAEDRTLDLLIRACSRAVQKYCRRDFALANYDELYSGSRDRNLLLRQYPVVAVDRVATCPTGVLRITNTSSVNQRAAVQVTSLGLTLVRVASGATTTDASITWASSATLSAVASAVTALGNGWSASVVNSTYSSWPSADLRPIQGALNVKDIQAELLLHVEELSDYGVDAERGILLHPSEWGAGVENYRVLYTAGYETVPEDVQEACAEWVAALFWQARRDPGVSQESVPGVVFRSVSLSVHGMPPQVKMLLAPYRKPRV
jgi:hypothetical protein